MADGRETSQRRDNASGKQLATQDSEDDNDDDEKKGELESSSSPSSSGDSINKDERSIGNKRRSSRHKSDDSSSALSLPNSFDDFTPVTTPAVSPAPSRLRTFDAELKRPPPVRTASSASFNNATNGQRIPDAMRKFYEVQVDKMRKQLAAVLEDKTQTQRVLAAERQKHDDVVAALQTSYRRDAAQWKNEKAAADARIALLERRLQAEKAQFVELRVSDALAQEFQKQDKDLLTLAEFVQMRVYELIQPHVSAADRAAKDLDVLASRHAECATAIADLERTARIAKQHEDRTARALKDMETERNGLAQQLEAVQAALLEQRRMQSTQAVDDGVNWREKFTSTDIELARTRQCVGGLQVEVDQLTQKVQLLSGDKAFLMQEKEAAMDKILKLSSALDEATANCRRLELSKETFLEQLEKTREESRVLFEHRMEVELAKLQDASRKEMELLRDNGKHLYERENRLLREARMDAQSQVDHLQKKVAELQHAYEDKVLELTRLDAKATTELAAVRNDLKIKHFELAQLGRQFDEKSQQLHQAHLENDMLKQKVDVHKAGFAKLEATTGKQITELQVAVAAEREKLEAYDKLEVDMDNAILQSVSDDASATFAMIPTAPKRRVRVNT
ncbi:hypothetical protein, variant [Aphanomyces invadans]|uniref:Uncharacterized protein n=1 Tax=Aphanomyces invadans TaxID=157072 RepID=A0A024TME5_9STRA|nr:hypothetical protein, variant [Aphanomyces invadans]ETV95315.1 hypothetical protein, variant [Aphanomyces invadans]|eukprot:XP_008876016.1 hypothetical protein, variant [Aphanomyces invadans]